jgi:hypothetical protein
MLWLLHWLAVHSGTVDEPGPYYGFWSGIGSDIGELALVGGMATLVRHRNCEVHGCWRLGRHQTAAGHRVCRRHHPAGHLTAGDVHAAHRQAIQEQGG